MASFSTLAAMISPWGSVNCFNYSSSLLSLSTSHSRLRFDSRLNITIEISANCRVYRNPILKHCTQFDSSNMVPGTDNEFAEEESQQPKTMADRQTPPLQRPRRRYRRKYPGEEKGVTEEMRFVAMKLRNSPIIKIKDNSAVNDEHVKGTVRNEGNKEENSGENVDGGIEEAWRPSMEGFLKYLADSKLVFNTIERIIDESSDVSYVYFRKTGLERSACINRDLEWLREQGNAIPWPSKPGVAYAEYLVELSDRSPPMFLCHLYNIYFSHITGGQVIAKQVTKKLLEGRDLEFYRWEGDAEGLLMGFREKLNALAEHWTRDEKNKCLREATKAFRFLGHIARLIIL